MRLGYFSRVLYHHADAHLLNHKMAGYVFLRALPNATKPQKARVSEQLPDIHPRTGELKSGSMG